MSTDTSTNLATPLLLSGNEAIALGALDAGFALGAGYPGTPSTEILEHFSTLGGRAEWAPNEKVALEVGLGVAFARARALVTMKHVGLNVAADALFTAAYTGVSGALVIVSADDPGMHSSQNEQDNRRYATAAGLPMLEPADSQESYDFVQRAAEISERWGIPVLLRVTTRVCHSKTLVRTRQRGTPAHAPGFVRDRKGRVMIPGHARPAHRRLRTKLAAIRDWNEQSDLNPTVPGESEVGIVTSGIAYMHVREAAPQAAVLKLGFTYPLPIERIRAFAASIGTCWVIEENDPWLADALRAAGIPVRSAPEMYRFGELNVERVRRILAGDTSPEPALPAGNPPQLCPGCPHRAVFQILSKMDLIVSGDIGCYTLGVLPPFEAMDAMVDMGASIGIGLGMRHVLPPAEARRVVSVIGDSTFLHSGLTGLVEMVYNPPPTGHLLIILDNGTTAMTGLQEHPGTGRRLDHSPSAQVLPEAMARAAGMADVWVIDPVRDPEALAQRIGECLSRDRLAMIVARRPCLLAARRDRALNATAQECPAS